MNAGAEAMGREASRRSFLGRSLAGAGLWGLASLLEQSGARAAEPAENEAWSGAIRPLHFPVRAKRVIHLCMAGGPSHLETFDYKEKLAELSGKPMPRSFTDGQPIAQLQNQELKILGPQHAFKKFGASGQEFCGLFEKLGGVADEMCIVRSLVTEAINHDPAHTFMNTGSTVSGRPSMGSWTWYGLGAESQELPGFVVLTSTGRAGQMQPIASRQWSAGFLPGRFTGVRLQSKGDAVHYIQSPPGIDPAAQRDSLDVLGALNRRLDESIHDPEIATRVNQYELAFRMQTSVPELMDFSDESAETMEMYGAKGGDGSFASNCLVARRLAERGVRFIQLYHRDWDHHGDVKGNIATIAPEVDGPCAALVADLKRRGMLDETLVIWGGEFGRTPMAQGNGRDHHIKGFSIWMAGGGIRPGISHGATDELGYNAVTDVVHVNDLHATILHLMGVDHRRLTYRFQGRDYRLTDVAGEVVKPILA
jgi:hypothetical protein